MTSVTEPETRAWRAVSRLAPGRVSPYHPPSTRPAETGHDQRDQRNEAAMGIVREFRDFAVKGNMLDMAVGIIIGAAFGTIVTSLVSDILMPPIGLLMGGVDFTEKYLLLKAGDPLGPYATVAAAKEAGAVTLNWGMFINAIISFLIVALAVFFVIRGVNRIRNELEREKEAPTPEPPPAPSAEEKLLAEIRDLLKTRS
jgi:large conductance mechanosensitive channel